MIKKILGICVAASAIVVAGKMISDYAETKPELKDVKEKIKKTGSDFTANCKVVGKTIKQVLEKNAHSKESESVIVG